MESVWARVLEVWLAAEYRNDIHLRIAKIKFCMSFMLVRKLRRLRAQQRVVAEQVSKFGTNKGTSAASGEIDGEPAGSSGLLRLSDDVLLVRILHQAMTPLGPELFWRICLVRRLPPSLPGRGRADKGGWPNEQMWPDCRGIVHVRKNERSFSCCVQVCRRAAVLRTLGPTELEW